ncbi:FG-GAP-like repeat-containing protein [Halocola ammonii]
MKKTYLLFAAACAFSFGLSAQSFSDQSGLLNDTYYSGGVVGVADMNNDGIDDIVIMDDSKNVKIEYGNLDSGLSFTQEEYTNVSGANQWGMVLGDVRNDGHKDVFSGGSYDGTHFVDIHSQGNFDFYDLAMGSLFMQACNMADINNDGWLDAFGCHDQAESRIWGNDQAGNLVPQNDWIDMATVPESDNSGNYGSVWTDYDHDGDLDLFIAKCRQGVNDPNDPRRINALFVNDGNGNYTEQAADHGLVIYEQSWTADFADIDNDGDFDCFITNHSGTLTLLENDGSGNFTDITAGSGLEISGFFLQAILKDFDNDGYVDLIYSGGTHKYFKNNGDYTFTEVPNMFPNDDTMHSFAIGDLNKDGYLDLYASYGNTYVNPDYNNPDILWMNDGGLNNNYIAFDLQGVISNMDAVGATVEIYGDWGVQIREVRAGESYGITNSFHLHFGLGTSASVDSAVISWPSGIEQTIQNPDINQYHELEEIGCVNEVADLTVDGETEICPGETVEITAPDGASSYDWSNGESGQTITVSEAGNYSATLYFDNECVGFTNIASIEVIEEESPEIQTPQDLTVCEGGSVLLVTDAENATWSTGDQVQELIVSESGEYTVTREGLCGTLTSEPVTVLVVETPTASTIDEISVGVGQSATLSNPSGNYTYWYDEETAENPVYEGADYTTDPITETTQFWYEEDVDFQGVPQFGGPENNDGPGAYHDNSLYWIEFDAYTDFVLKSVKVYANGDGNRSIVVVDSNGDVVVEDVFFIEDGESRVDVNFEIPAGTGYGLKSNSQNPQLYRNGIGTEPDFPYEIGSTCAITGTNIENGNDLEYYYFFYDWEIEPTVTCRSDRASVTVTITNINEIESVASLNVFPNPASDVIKLSMELSKNTPLTVSLLDQLGQQIETRELNDLRTGSNEVEMDVSDLSGGVYFLQIESEGRVATRKIVVQ